MNFLLLRSFLIQSSFNLACDVFASLMPKSKKQPCCLIILLLFNFGFTQITLSRSSLFIIGLNSGLSFRMSCNSLDISVDLLKHSVFDSFLIVANDFS